MLLTKTSIVTKNQYNISLTNVATLIETIYPGHGKYIQHYPAPVDSHQITLANLRGVCHWREPPRGPNSFNFMQCLGKFGKIVCWRSPSPRVGALTSGKFWTSHWITCKILLVIWVMWASRIDALKCMRDHLQWVKTISHCTRKVTTNEDNKVCYIMHSKWYMYFLEKKETAFQIDLNFPTCWCHCVLSLFWYL